MVVVASNNNRKGSMCTLKTTYILCVYPFRFNVNGVRVSERQTANILKYIHKNSTQNTKSETEIKQFSSQRQKRKPNNNDNSSNFSYILSEQANLHKEIIN